MEQFAENESNEGVTQPGKLQHEEILSSTEVGKKSQMDIKIIQRRQGDRPVSLEILIDSLERSRDRVRTIGNMVVTTIGILIPAVLAFLLFLLDKGLVAIEVVILLLIAILLFLIASCLSIISSFFKRYLLINEMQFTHDLINKLNKEVKMIYSSFLSLMLGILVMIMAVIIFFLEHRR